MEFIKLTPPPIVFNKKGDDPPLTMVGTKTNKVILK